MFTGIVQECAQVEQVSLQDGVLRLELALSPERCAGLVGGASVAVNGTCLTVARQQDTRVGFDVIAETLRLTNLATLQAGSRVNVERSATFADEIGGHRVSGHVSGTTQVLERRDQEANRVLRFALDDDWSRFLFHKGFVALDGASLTISALDREEGWFEVSLIPETLQRTLFGGRDVGDVINVEVDSETVAVVETVERVLADPQWRQRLA